MVLEGELEELVQEAHQLEKYPIAKLITLLERDNNHLFRKALFTLLESKFKNNQKGYTIGITGTPGAGKSSLIGELTKEFLKNQSGLTVAIVAIDPSSRISGGSILGDRTRVLFPPREKRVYFRSQPSQLELGGVNPYTYHVIRLLRYFFDYIIVETVGIGQNEIEVSWLCDYSFLVMQPLGGDQIQFMKSGIMEVPDAFIINKMDEELLGNSSYSMLVASLEFMKEIFPNGNIPPIFKTSVVKKIGIHELWKYIVNLTNRKDRNKETIYQLEKWIRNEFGRLGIQIMLQWKEQINTNSFVSYEELESSFHLFFHSRDWRELYPILN